MIDIRIHVCVKAVLIRSELVPERPWLLRHKLDLCQRLRTLETVLPRHNEPKRRAVLIAQWFAVKADRDECQFVARFFDCEAFGIGPGKIV